MKTKLATVLLLFLLLGCERVVAVPKYGVGELVKMAVSGETVQIVDVTCFSHYCVYDVRLGIVDQKRMYEGLVSTRTVVENYPIIKYVNEYELVK